MRILFAAPVTFENITFFISSYFIGFAKAFEQLGHKTKILQTTDTNYPKFLNKFRRKHNKFRRKHSFFTNVLNDIYTERQILIEVREFKPDIVFLHFINSYDLSKLIIKLKKMGIIVLYWRGVNPIRINNGIINCLKNSNYILIYDDNYLDYYKYKLKLDNVYILPLGCDLEYYDSFIPNHDYIEKNKVDICFYGLYNLWRESFLISLKDFDLGIWSWNFNDYNSKLSSKYKGIIHGETLVKTLKSCKIAVNIHLKSEIGGGNYRLFEIPATKTFQLVDNKINISKYFDVGKEIITFNDQKDLKEKAIYYLKNDKERNDIALASYQKVKNEHTLKHRAIKLIDFLNKNV